MISGSVVRWPKSMISATLSESVRLSMYFRQASRRVASAVPSRPLRAMAAGSPILFRLPAILTQLPLVRISTAMSPARSRRSPPPPLGWMRGGLARVSLMALAVMS